MGKDAILRRMARNMGLQDTSKEAADRYFDILRALSRREGGDLGGLVAAARHLATVSVRLAHPGASEREVEARVAARLYGNDVAARFFKDGEVECLAMTAIETSASRNKPSYHS